MTGRFPQTAVPMSDLVRQDALVYVSRVHAPWAKRIANLFDRVFREGGFSLARTGSSTAGARVDRAKTSW
jgi:hypothetical protein